MRVEIEGDTVTVSWDHIEPDQTFKGYYVVLEDVGSGQKENPAYVHVSSGERCAKIIGLRPGTSYTLMVNDSMPVYCELRYELHSVGLCSFV